MHTRDEVKMCMVKPVCTLVLLGRVLRPPASSCVISQLWQFYAAKATPE